MRIISGKHKYRKILTEVKGSRVLYRPTTDRTRQAIFNMVFNSTKFEVNINEATVFADICCGSGSFGLEAISRGINKVYFVDIEADQITLANTNAKNFGEEDKCVFIKADAKALMPIPHKCELIFIDPPYHLRILNNILSALLKADWMSENCLIVVECPKRERIDVSIFNVLDERIYGKTKLIFLKVKRLI